MTGYPLVPLKRFGRIVGGATPTADEANWDGDIPWYTPTDVSAVHGGVLGESARALTADGLASCSAVLMPAGSVVMTSRAPIGNVALTDRAAATNQGCKSLVPAADADARFVAYAAQAFVEQIRVAGTGTTFQEVSGERLGTVRLPKPPHERQVDIADFLDQETARVAAGLSRAAGVPPETDRLLFGLTDGLASDVLRRLKFGLEGPLSYGASENSTEGEPDWPRFIRITDIDPHGDLRDDVRRLPPEVAGPYLLSDGDVLLARSGATVGKSFLYEAAEHGPCCYAGYLVRARCDRRRLLPEFLLLITLSERWWDQIALALTQATIPNVSAARYGEMLVPMPEMHVQHELVERGLRLRRATAWVRSHHRALSERLIEYRDSLVHEAITGRLDVAQMTEQQMDERLQAASEGRLDEVAV